jgi:hypothetical protein
MPFTSIRTWSLLEGRRHPAHAGRGERRADPAPDTPEASYDAIVDNEIGSLKWGVFNLGFHRRAQHRRGRRFLDWWSDRTYQFCRADVAGGLFTDQKWLNLAPIFFDGVAIIRSSRHNVATWNLTTRRMTGSMADGYRVDGEPLGFYHFTGFDSGAHGIMAGRMLRATTRSPS